MQRQQADRARIAARTTRTSGPNPRSATGFYTGPITIIAPPVGPVRNRKAVRMTAIQRDSTGKRSAWNRSPYAPYGGWR